MYNDFDNQFKEIITCFHPYAERLNLIQSIRNKIDDVITSNFTILNSIKEEGYYSLGELLDEKQLIDINNHLKDKLVCDSHVPPGGSGLNKLEYIRQYRSAACYPTETILTCPHLLEIALHRDVLSIVENYLECVPILYGFNLYHTFALPQHNYIGGIKSFHRDGDDAAGIGIFIYLSDVDENSGPHTYIKYSHNEKKFLEKTNNQQLLEQIFPPSPNGGGYVNDELIKQQIPHLIHTITGKPGFGFFEDTFGLHRGEVLLKDRLMFWARYGLHRNQACKDTIPYPPPVHSDFFKDRIKFDKKLKFITRVMIQHD